MRQFSLLAAILLTIAPTAFGVGWTETFDNGVGRFNITTGQGDTMFAYDPGKQDLSCTFLRGPRADRRLASLGGTLTQNEKYAISLEWTPSYSTNSYPWPSIGFFDQATMLPVVTVRPGVYSNNHGAHLWYMIDYGSQSLDTTEVIPPWNFGDTYLLTLSVDGENHLVTLSQSIRSNDVFVLQGTATAPIDQSNLFSVDSVGIGNLYLDDEGFGATLACNIDNFSFVPEPSTALLALGGLAIMRTRRRFWQCNIDKGGAHDSF